MDYESRITRWTVLPQGKELFSDQATQVLIMDGPNSEFVQVAAALGGGPIYIEPDEWPELRSVIDAAIALCRPNKE